MHLFELIDWLESEYVSGCQAFYAHQEPDPWHQAFEDMNAEFQSAKGFEAQSAVVAKFQKVFAKLLAAYEKQGADINLTRPWEGFYSTRCGLENVSTNERACLICGETRKPLKIFLTEKGKLPVFKCKDHERARI